MNTQQEPQYTVLQIKLHETIASTEAWHLMRRNDDGQPYFPDNANPEKSSGNRILIDPFTFTKQYCNNGLPSNTSNKDKTGNNSNAGTICNIMRAVNARIQSAGVKTRKNQKRALEIVASGSYETMSALNEAQLQEWARLTVKWAEETFHKENIVAAVLHVDEKTPHIHFIIVPIDNCTSRRSRSRARKIKKETGHDTSSKLKKCLRLSADEFFNTQKNKEYHTSYAKDVGAHFGLKRPVEGTPGSKKSHIPSIEYNRRLEREKNQLVQELQELKKQRAELLPKEAAAEILDKKILSLKKERESLEKELSDIRKQAQEATKMVKLYDEVIKRTSKDWEPKKTTNGYEAEDVEHLMALYRSLLILEGHHKKQLEENKRQTDELRNYSGRIATEMGQLRDLYNSPALLQKRLAEIQKKDAEERAKEILEYVFEKDVSIHSIDYSKTKDYLPIVARFTMSGLSSPAFAVITREYDVRCTRDLSVSSLEIAKKRWDEPIWAFKKTWEQVSEGKAAAKQRSTGPTLHR